MQLSYSPDVLPSSSGRYSYAEYRPARGPCFYSVQTFYRIKQLCPVSFTYNLRCFDGSEEYFLNGY
jgi:hypothetical protein